jgi:hypothetical protein
MKSALVVCLVASSLVACGGGDDADAPDNGPGPGGADAGPDGPMPGTKQAFDDCAVTEDCPVGNDCRQVGWFTGNFKVCMPKCQTSNDCPFNSYCYPDIPGQPQFAFMKDHCWFSLCGPDPQNGTVNGPCKLGAETRLPAAQQRDGYCTSINDASFGQCIESGSVAPGGACDFSNPTRGGKNCDSTSLCLGQSGQTQGTCFQSCDPEKILTGAPGNCGAVAGSECLDRTDVRTVVDMAGTPTVITATFAYCDTVKACKLVGPNTCPTGQACVQTNPARITGVCDASGAGEIDAFQACTPPQASTPAAMRCDPGSFCFGPQGASKCEPFCDRPASGTPAVTCQGGTTCTQVLWNAGTDMMAGTPDDNRTQGWGLCQ